MLKSLSEKNSEPYLDGLRGLAALMVLAHHTILYQDRPYLSSHIRTAIDYGFHGVSLFFIVSAFTLIRSWDLRKNQDPSPVQSFYLRRAFRILPFWWLNVGLSVLRQSPPIYAVVANVLMFFPFFPFDPTYLIVPYGWSVGVEETFYVLFPVWILLTRKYWSLVSLLVFFVWVAIYWQNNFSYYFPNPQNPEYYFTFPVARYFCFFIGLLVYKVSIDPRYLSLRQKCPLALLYGIELFFIFFLLNLPRFQDPIATFLLGPFVLICAHPRSLFNKILHWRIFSQVGICCYSFYLLHYYALENLRYLKPWLTYPLTQISGEIEFIILFVVAGLLSFIISAVSFQLIERPSVLCGRAVILYLQSRKKPLQH